MSTSTATVATAMTTVRIAGQGEYLAERGLRKTGSTIRPAVIYGRRVAQRLARELAENNPRISAWAEPAPGATDGWRVGIEGQQQGEIHQ